MFQIAGQGFEDERIALDQWVEQKKRKFLLNSLAFLVERQDLKFSFFLSHLNPYYFRFFSACWTTTHPVH